MTRSGPVKFIHSHTDKFSISEWELNFTCVNQPQSQFYANKPFEFQFGIEKVRRAKTCSSKACHILVLLFSGAWSPGAKVKGGPMTGLLGDCAHMRAHTDTGVVDFAHD